MADLIHHFHLPIGEKWNFVEKNISLANIDRRSVHQYSLLNDALNDPLLPVYSMYLMVQNER